MHAQPCSACHYSVRATRPGGAGTKLAARPDRSSEPWGVCRWWVVSQVPEACHQRRGETDAQRPNLIRSVRWYRSAAPNVRRSRSPASIIAPQAAQASSYRARAPLRVSDPAPATRRPLRRLKAPSGPAEPLELEANFRGVLASDKQSGHSAAVQDSAFGSLHDCKHFRPD